MAPGGFLNPTPEMVKGEGDDMILLPAFVPQASELIPENILEGNLKFLGFMMPGRGE